MRRPPVRKLRRALVAAGLLAVAAALRAPAGAQQAPPVRFLAPVGLAEPAPVDAPPLDAEAARLQAAALPIALPVALRLSVANNLDVARARETSVQAGIVFDRARVAFLPTFNLGSAYNHHEGPIQKTEGNIIYANRDGLFVGGGPSYVSVGLADALFAPLVARQVAAGTQARLAGQVNDTLLSVADVYFAVLRARRRLARIEETLDFLTGERPSPTRAGSKGLLPVVQAVQIVGGAEATRAEVERVRVEVLRRLEEKAGALQDFRVAMAELARLLRLDAQVPLWPVEDFRFPLDLPGARWADAPLDELVRVALTNRPELAESQALIQAAVERVKSAQFRPLLPYLALSYNWGDFGGGPDPVTTFTPATKTAPAKVTTTGGFGPSGAILHFSPRTDFDVSVVWKLQNLGLGDLANVREERSRLRQAEFVRLQVRDRVVAQVVQAQEQVRRWRERVEVTRAALFNAQGAPEGPVFQALRLNFDRIRTVPATRPLEVLDSIRGLNDTLEAYGQAITEYERARFGLLIALGLPPAELLVPPPAPPKE